MKRVIQLALLLLVLLGIMVGALAFGAVQDNENGRAVFTAKDRQIIHGYYKRTLGNIAPGSLNRSPLALEIDRDIVPGGRIPKYFEKELQRLPRELDSQLSSLNSAYQRFKIGNHVVLARRDMFISDVVRDAGFK
jgi:hypothetical protein